MNGVESATHLAFVGLDVGVDDHVSLERLLLDEALVAQVALIRPDVGVNQNVPLHVGQQRELTATDATLVLLHSLKDEDEQSMKHHTRLGLYIRFTVMHLADA